MNSNLKLDYILSHFQEPVFPRTISTKSTRNAQVVAYDIQEVLTRFKQADWFDCRISAYPPNATVNPSHIERFQGLKYSTPRNLVVIIDLDLETFCSERALNIALAKTLRNIETKLGVQPTVIWSGNGYHIYLVLDCPINLENAKQLIELEVNQPSLKFLKFTESFLSYDKSDGMHNNTVTYNNCMMRVPGSINSKNNCEVRLVQEWDHNRPAVNYLLTDFMGYVVNEKVQELRARTVAEVKAKIRAKKKVNFNYNNTRYYEWIEQILRTPMSDHRKFIVWMVLPQYLVNVKRLSYEEADIIINDWLDKCNELERLDRTNMKQKIKAGFSAAEKGFGPISVEKLRIWKPKLAELLNI